MPGSVHSGSASWDNCDQVFPDELCVSSFVLTLCLDSGIVSPLGLCWVKGVCVFRCNLPPALLAEWQRSFTCHCVNRGVEWTLNKSQHAKLTLEKKILPPLLPEFELTTFWSQVWRSNQQAIPAPLSVWTLNFKVPIYYSSLAQQLSTAWNLSPFCADTLKQHSCATWTLCNHWYPKDNTVMPFCVTARAKGW